MKEVSRQQVEHVAYGSRRVFVAVSEESILPARQLSLLFLDVSRILYGLRHKAPTRMDYGPGHPGGRSVCLVGGVGVPSNPMLVLGIADFESEGAKTRFFVTDIVCEAKHVGMVTGTGRTFSLETETALYYALRQDFDDIMKRMYHERSLATTSEAEIVSEERFTLSRRFMDVELSAEFIGTFDL